MIDNPKTRHAEQSFPYEWDAYRHCGETLIVHDIPEHDADCYRLAGWTTNVRSTVLYDVVLYEGDVTTPHYEDGVVIFGHSFGGEMGWAFVTDQLRKPVPLLERCERVNL